MALAEMEARTMTKVVEVQERVGGLEAKRADFESKLEVLEKGLQDLTNLVKSGAGNGARGDGGDTEERRKHTLVVGGWPKDSRRKVILKDPSEALQALRLTDRIDQEPFTTGARRSVALMPMPRRPGESESDHRNRMFGIVQTFVGSEVLTKEGKKLWCTFSKTPEQRLISSHAGLIKRVIAGFREIDEDLLDFEYKTGTVWSEGGMIGSSCLPCPPGTDIRPAGASVRGNGTEALDQLGPPS